MTLDITRSSVSLRADVPSSTTELGAPSLSRVGNAGDVEQKSERNAAQSIPATARSYEGQDVQGPQGVRPGKIAAIREALAKGAYHVSAADIASRLVDHMLGE